MNGTSTASTTLHSRQSSQSSIRNSIVAQQPQYTGPSYVQQMRMAKATVWAERGPRDAVNEGRKVKPQSTAKKSRFGMKMFNGPTPAGTQAKPGKTKLRLYAAPQHTTLVPRLSASEANDNDDFDNFASAAPTLAEKRMSNAPSITRSSLHHTASRTNSLLNSSATVLEPTAPATAPSSPGRLPHRMDSVASSNANSSILEDKQRTGQAVFSLPVGAGSQYTVSRTGSPTQLQQYTTHHLNVSDSDCSDPGNAVAENRPRLFIANADISDSD